MIETIVWKRRGIQTPSAFLRGSAERPLRVTLHTSSFQNLSDDEIEILELLSELSSLPELDILQTEAGSLPHIDLGDFENATDDVRVRVIYQGEPRRFTHVLYPKQYYEMAVRMGGHEAQKADVGVAFQDLLIARAHTVLDQDILVTKSPWLLNHPKNVFVREANPRTILDAAKVIGLFLRSRDRYVYRIVDIATLSFDRGLFYWVLVRQYLPNLWRYFSACVESQAIRKDDVLFVGQSILRRCERALQARDKIGEQFYVPQGNSTRDVMMYHFDYLTLLLGGALDAEAVIAHRVYGLAGEEKQASFRRAGFVKALEQMKAKRLYALVTSQKSKDLLAILFELRNTIHRAALTTLGYISVPHSEASYIEVDPGLANILWAATQRLATPEEWGLVKEVEMMIEPYTCAAMLVRECLQLIDEIAAATDIEALFMGQPAPKLMDAPPEDDVFGSSIRKRLSLLG